MKSLNVLIAILFFASFVQASLNLCPSGLWHKEHCYKTLDGVSYDQNPLAPVSTSVLTIPEGWQIAAYSNDTLDLVAYPWGAKCIAFDRRTLSTSIGKNGHCKYRLDTMISCGQDGAKKNSAGCTVQQDGVTRVLLVRIDQERRMSARVNLPTPVGSPAPADPLEGCRDFANYANTSVLPGAGLTFRRGEGYVVGLSEKQCCDFCNNWTNTIQPSNPTLYSRCNGFQYSQSMIRFHPYSTVQNSNLNFRPGHNVIWITSRAQPLQTPVGNPNLTYPVTPASTAYSPNGDAGAALISNAEYLGADISLTPGTVYFYDGNLDRATLMCLRNNTCGAFTIVPSKCTLLAYVAHGNLVTSAANQGNSIFYDTASLYQAFVLQIFYNTAGAPSCTGPTYLHLAYPQPDTCHYLADYVQGGENSYFYWYIDKYDGTYFFGWYINQYCTVALNATSDLYYNQNPRVDVCRRNDRLKINGAYPPMYWKFYGPKITSVRLPCQNNTCY